MQHDDDLGEILESELAPSVNDLLYEIGNELEHPEPWIPTGFSRMDNYLDGGLRPGEVMLIAARPSVGKSAFALQIVSHMIDNDVPCTVWSLEMRPKQWIRRGVAAVSGVPLPRIRKGECTAEDHYAIAHAMGAWKDKPLHFAPSEDDTTPKGFSIRAQLEQMEHDSKVMVIDYLQLMQPPQAGSREQEVAQTSRNLKLTANRLGVGIIALAQLKRDAEGKVPQMSDLRESGALEQDADIIVFLHREQDKETNLYGENGLVIVGKNRDGRTGGVPSRYNWKRFRFDEVT